MKWTVNTRVKMRPGSHNWSYLLAVGFKPDTLYPVVLWRDDCAVKKPDDGRFYRLNLDPEKSSFQIVSGIVIKKELVTCRR